MKQKNIRLIKAVLFSIYSTQWTFVYHLFVFGKSSLTKRSGSIAIVYAFHNTNRAKLDKKKKKKLEKLGYRFEQSKNWKKNYRLSNAVAAAACYC
jgi:hypothetical protein